jgi:cobalt-zinc-cadmium efflux system outer membrane protein
MRKTVIFAGLFAVPYLALAQGGSSMPGMDMGQKQEQKQEQKQPAPKPKPQQQSMPGMDMGGQQGAKPNPMQLPGDMQSPLPRDPGAQKETQSERNSEQQQPMPGMDMKPAPGSDAQSTTHASGVLQEPENPSYHTGEELPAPELLNDVAKRAPLALAQFQSWAEHGNPTLAQARSFVRRSEQQGRQAGLYPNPSIAYDGEHIRGGSYGAGEQGAYVQQAIVLGGKLGLRRDIYRQQAGVDTIGVEAQTFRVRNNVEQAFDQALTSQATVVLRGRLLHVTLDALQTAHQLANVGQADAPDILQSEVEAEQAKVDFVRAQREYIQNFRTLAAVANQPELPVSPLTGDLEHPPQIDPEQQVATIVASSPEVKRAQAEVMVAQARLKDAHREPVPDLTLRVGEWWSGEITEGTQRAAGPMSFVTAGIDLPLWNRNQGNIEAAKADLERAREDVTRTQLYLKQESEPLAQQYLTAQFEADRYRTQLIPRARRAYELYLMKYQQMAMAYPQVLVSQRTLFQLQIDYLRALSTVWTYGAALQNYRLSGGLEAPMSTGATLTTINLPSSGGSE